jgi:Mg2+-importing ATPase
MFRTGWFLVSTATELSALLVLRSSRPFWRSRPGRWLMMSSGVVVGVTALLPFTPLASTFGFVAPTTAVLGLVAAITFGYVIVNELVKGRTSTSW